jgi:hypothetical protein
MYNFVRYMQRYIELFIYLFVYVRRRKRGLASPEDNMLEDEAEDKRTQYVFPFLHKIGEITTTHN